jgi:hypothetical protein
VQPGHVIDVRAFVYAQEGSWIVIPGDFFDPVVKNNSDLDRDGVVSRAEQVAAYRFNRYNYKSTSPALSWKTRAPLSTTPMAVAARLSVPWPIG